MGIVSSVRVARCPFQRYFNIKRYCLQLFKEYLAARLALQHPEFQKSGAIGRLSAVFYYFAINISKVFYAKKLHLGR